MPTQLDLERFWNKNMLKLIGYESDYMCFCGSPTLVGQAIPEEYTPNVGYAYGTQIMCHTCKLNMIRSSKKVISLVGNYEIPIKVPIDASIKSILYKDTYIIYIGEDWFNLWDNYLPVVFTGTGRLDCVEWSQTQSGWIGVLDTSTFTKFSKFYNVDVKTKLKMSLGVELNSKLFTNLSKFWDVMLNPNLIEDLTQYPNLNEAYLSSPKIKTKLHSQTKFINTLESFMGTDKLAKLKSKGKIAL